MPQVSSIKSVNYLSDSPRTYIVIITLQVNVTGVKYKIPFTTNQISWKLTLVQTHCWFISHVRIIKSMNLLSNFLSTYISIDTLWVHVTSVQTQCTFIHIATFLVRHPTVFVVAELEDPTMGVPGLGVLKGPRVAPGTLHTLVTWDSVVTSVHKTWTVHGTLRRKIAKHCNNVTWVSWHLKLAVTQLFAHQIVQANSKENITAPHYLTFVSGISSPHNGQ